MEVIKKNILITGVTGFIGSYLYQNLIKDPKVKVWHLRSKRNKATYEGNYIDIDDFKSDFDIIKELKNIDCIIHLAALAHSNHNKDLINDVNINFSINLAKQAAQSNVEKFIFLSSIKVYGETSEKNIIYNEESDTFPKTAYARAKLNAENLLIKLSKESNLKVIIIRSPLVYGKNPKANLRKLNFLIKNKIPFPKISKINYRSFIAIDNLVSFINICINSAKASNQIYCISDEENISIYEFINYISISLNKKITYFNINGVFLYFIFYFFGKKRTYHSIFSDLRVSANKAKSELGWIPIISTKDAIKKYLI